MLTTKHHRGNKSSLAWAIAGVVPGLPVLVGYYGAFTYEGPDGQAGIVFAVFPIYQVSGAGIIGGVIAMSMKEPQDNNANT